MSRGDQRVAERLHLESPRERDPLHPCKKANACISLCHMSKTGNQFSITRAASRSQFLSVLAATTLATFAGRSAHAAESELPLVQNGRSAYAIVYATNAPGSVRTAAQELQRYIEQSSGAKLPIVAGNASARSPFIALGDTPAARAAGLSVRDVPLEGFRLVSHGGNLFIVGSDTREGETTSEGGTSSGTLNGVYTFIEDHLNVRWLIPGPLGEDVPARASVLVPAIDRTERPFFHNRRLPGMQNTQPAVQEWSARQKLGFSMHLDHAHNWHRVVPATLQEQHPDWFAEIDGKRPPVVGDRYKLETTNPALIEHYAQAAISAFRRDPKLAVFSLSPTDSGNWSTSAASKALYDRDPHGKLSVTPLVLKFYNDVAKIVAREFPDRKLAGYIYASYLYPPTAGVPRLEPNLFLVVAPSISYGYQLYRESTQQDWEMIMKAWSGQTEKIAYYDLFNWLRGNTGALTPPAPEILNFAFPRLMKYGIKGVYLYGTAEWSQAGVNNYVLAKMAWNPALDANAVCDEFYRRAYGSAAGARVREINHLVDAAVKVFYNQDLTANYTATPRYLKDVLAANYARIEAHFLEAQRAAATPAQRARLQFFGDNLVLMQWQLRAHGFLPETKTSPLYRGDAEVDQMMGRVHPGFGVALAPGMKRTEKTFPPVRAAWAPSLPHPRPITPLALRGRALFLVFPNADQEIRITATRISSLGSLVRCAAYSASGEKVAGAVLQPNSTVQFLGAAGQIYYVEVSGEQSYYELKLTGAPYALSANSEPRGLHLQGKATPLYFQVPAGASPFTITLNSAAPGETSLSRLYAPSGKLVETFDTQTTPVARATITPARAGGEWDGFWCLSVEKAPKGVFDDVYVTLDAAFPLWFTLDPAQPLTISALNSQK